jgi:hypothetical protein
MAYLGERDEEALFHYTTESTEIKKGESTEKRWRKGMKIILPALSLSPSPFFPLCSLSSPPPCSLW